MMPDGKAWLFTRQRPARRAAARRTTSRSSRRCATSSIPNVGSNPVGDHLRPAREPAGRARATGLSAHRLDLPPDRAPHRRPDEPQPPVAGRAAARDVRRDRPGARARSRHRGRRLDGRSRRRAREIEASAKVTEPDAAAAAGRTRGAPGLPAVALGHVHDERAGRRRATRSTTSWRISGDPNVTIQESKAFRCRVRAGRRESETTEKLAHASERSAPRDPTTPSSRTAWPTRRRARSSTAAPTGRSDMPAEITEIAIRVPEARRMGFFTDTTVCIGCKACEVACKQWNDLPADGSPNGKQGISLDYTGAPVGVHLAPRALRGDGQADREQQQAAREMLDRGEGGRLPSLPAPDEIPAGSGRAGAAGGAPSLVSSPVAAGSPRGSATAAGGETGALLDRWVFHVRRLQALHERRLPRRLPDGCAHPDGVRDGHRAVRHLQRLRLLRRLLPVRRDRPRPLRRPGREVHALLRPPPGRPRTGVREGLPDRLDPVRALRGAGGDGEEARGRAA